MKKVYKNKDFCRIVMPSEIECNQYMKPDKMQYIIAADIEPLFKKILHVQIIQKILQQQKLESI